MRDDLLSSLPAALQERAAFVGERRPTKPRFVVYWMRVAMRGHDNPALDVALACGRELGIPVVVYQGLSERYPYASDRHHTFVLEGAADVARELEAKQLAYLFHLERPGHRGRALKALAKQAGLVVCDAMPTPPLRAWTRAVAAKTATVEVDASCVQPMSLSPSAPQRAYVFEDHLRRQRRERLERLVRGGWNAQPAPKTRFVPDTLPFEPLDVATLDDVGRAEFVASCAIDHGVGPVRATRGGSEAGYARWKRFARERLADYAKHRDDPLADATSSLSAYLHYGMISPFRLAAEATKVGGEGADTWLDELLTWRELAWHFCAHEADPESLSALPKWARETLHEHDVDDRAPKSWETLARAKTGDALWDAAQRSLLRHGTLHNALRMTWGKAVPAWTRTPKEALGTLIDLNHRYALDGRDPASYGGLLWCLGLFDRPFEPSAPVLGLIRARDTKVHAERLDVAAYAAKVDAPRERPRVAVVGAGIAGLTCARTLVDHGLSVVLFDKGGRAPGGRCATRWDSKSEWASWVIDHGAQLLAPPASATTFRRLLRSWEQHEVVAPWEARFVRFEDGRAVRDEGTRHVASPTMSRLAAHLAEDLDVRLGARVDVLEREGEGWRLRGREGSGPPGSGREGNEADFGAFDFVVIAVPAPQAVPLLAHAPHLRAAAEQAEMDPCLAALVAFDRRVEPGWDAAFDPEGELVWMSRESSKPGRPSIEDGDGALDAWILHASPAHSEALLELDTASIANELLESFAAKVGKLPKPKLLVGHRWRYAQVATPVGEDCLFDREAKLGACGDWCLGARVDDAFASGLAMAGRILAL
ncbi:MAG: FAD-dependent oxidoreductase [Sandaracinus sp.]|nr:FAD-dependent oxidoreductase [Sandaracinus sp.]